MKFFLSDYFFAHLILLAIAGVIFLTGCRSFGEGNDFASVERSFITPPDSVQSSVYWYWISDNISKEGVVKDLQSMKAAGINRAFIGNIGLSPGEAPYGKVKILSDEWWDILHTALKTATELNIEIGIFNSPGWSQSGGPWIKPEQSMRYLASAELRVKGPQKLTQILEKPTSEFQDVKVIAWPVNQDYNQNLFNLPQVRLEISDSKMIVQQPSKDPSTFILPEGESYIGIVIPQEKTARSLRIYPSGGLYAECELQVKDGKEFRTVKSFTANRTNWSLNVGFDPAAPVAVSFPETNAAEYRIVFRNAHRGSSIGNIILSPVPVVESYAEKSLAKMFQTPLPQWNDYLWPAQTEVDPALAIAPQQVQDISSHLAADGTLTWDVPEGEWIIMRTGMAPTGVINAPASPEGTGPEVDKMSKKHVEDHFNAFLGKIIERIPPADRKSWKVVVEDSYETGGQNFTDNFMDEFKNRYGYDPLPYLPVFRGYVVGSPDLSDRFLWDVRRMVADKVSYDYVGGLREVSHNHGLTTWLENYGHWGFPGEFLQYGGQSDEIGGEFWSEGDLGSIENRAASSCAHIYGKSKVSAESFTCAGNAYSRYPATMKRRGDWSFTEGINNTLMHVYIHQPYEEVWPGLNAWFGNEFNRKNTWFGQMDLFVTYLKRCNFMLQQGVDVADVAYFIGEDAPKMTGIRNPGLPKGYSFDYINAEVIVRDLAVKNGRLVLPHGTSYRLLVLPELETMRPEVLQKIEQLLAAGAVILGNPPSRSPSLQNYPESDKTVKELAGKLWGNDMSIKSHSYGKGMIYSHMDTKEVLDLLGVVPDCLFGKDDPALYTHRTMKDGEIYFISNQSDQKIRTTPQFRVQGMQPELWDAVTGTIRDLPAFEPVGEVTSVPLQLEAFESAFVIFRHKGNPKTKEIKANYPDPAGITELTAPWNVTFESDSIKRGPAGTIVLNQLEDWVTSKDEHIRYYSGTAVYNTSFALKDKPEKQLFLDLGTVSVMAKIKINGEYAGGVWTAPYRLDISKLVQAGENTLEVEVVNTWVNRLIGDQNLPEEKRRTTSRNSPWRADSPLQSSGLIGPVRLFSMN